MDTSCEMVTTVTDSLAGRICPLCGKVCFESAWALDTVEVRRCEQCGFAFASRGDGAECEAGYYQSMGGYEQFVEVKKAVWRELLHDLGTRTAGRRLLEVGCARGYALALAREYGWLPHGVEVSREDAAFAQLRFGLSIHHGTVESCTLAKESFDVVLMWSVIEHIPDPISALRACRRLLKPGGLLSIHTCNAASKAAAAMGRKWSMYHLPGHVSFFNTGTIRQALSKAGFSVERLETGLGGTPVDVNPAARSQLTPRRAVAYVASALGLKDTLREMICLMQPKLREQGEFISVLARRDS